jgi:hypothetical protein
MGIASLIPAAIPATSSAQKPSGSSSVWTEETKVERKVKPNRTPRRPRPKVEKVPLLTLEYRVLKRGQDGASIEANPVTTFHAKDRVRVAIKVNQDGYLYIINQTEDQNAKVVVQPHLIFPDSRIKDGQNFVKMNEEVLLPSYCSPGYDDHGVCWWKMDDKAGSEDVILIFSRDLITDLEDNTVAGVIKPSYIAQLKSGSDQNKKTSRPDLSPSQGGGAGRYITWVTNTNPKDNEELIETISLNHVEASRN